ncbi:MAG TPA: MinD/ParA family protein, partial [Mizugakiibacter sp.]|nr:MinD/ParA family protein [Mizugakiibacter sp.]
MFATSNHQAQGLAKLVGQRDTQVIAITGGKGGVGKTSIAVNLSMVMAMNGGEVALLDADLGLANVDVHLGLCPQRHLGHLLDGECDLAGLMLEAAHGLKVIPASSGRRRMAQLGSAEHAALIHAVAEYPEPLDTLIVDTAAGLSDSVTMFCSAADEVVVVLTDEPASLTDAYALIKVLSHEYSVNRFRLLTNLTTNARQGRELFLRLRRVTDHFLDVVLDHMGNV